MTLSHIKPVLVLALLVPSISAPQESTGQDRIAARMQSFVDEGQIAGAVTLVDRRSRVEVPPSLQAASLDRWSCEARTHDPPFDDAHLWHRPFAQKRFGAADTICILLIQRTDLASGDGSQFKKALVKLAMQIDSR